MTRKINSATILWILCALGISALPYFYNGVFFERGHNIVDLILLIILLIGIAYGCIWSFMKKSGRLDSANHIIFKPNRYDIAFGIFVLCYIQAAFHASNIHLAIVGATDSLALIVPYFIFRFRLQSGLGSTLVLFGLALTSIGVNVIGMANGWGQLSYPSSISTSQGIQISSVFQYHNAYAAFTAAISLGLLTFISLRESTNSIVRALGIGVASLNIAGLILSGSRGALALWIGVCILTIISLRDKSGNNATRFRFLRDFYFSLISAGVAYVLIHKGISHTSALFGWIGIISSFIIAFVIVFGFSMVANKYKSGLSTWKRPFLSLIGVGVVCVGLIGAANINSLLHKISSYQVDQLSVAQRFIFWKDGLKIVGLNPLFGTGSGTWQAMFMSVESYPYYSTRVHSFLIDILMEAGIIGLLALLTAIWPLIRCAVWRKLTNLNGNDSLETAGLRSLAICGLMIFVHSFMDWDMSYLFLEMLFVIGIASASNLYNSAEVESRNVGIWVHNSFRATLSVICLLSMIAVYFTTQSIRAQDFFSSSKKASTVNVQQEYALLTEAHKVDPFNASYLISTATLILQQPQIGVVATKSQTALNMFKQASNLEPYNPEILGHGAWLAYQIDDYQTAARMATQAFNNAPFLQDYITLALNGNALYGLSNGNSNPAVSLQAFKQVQDLYTRYLVNLNIVQNLPSYLPPLDPYQLQDFAYDSIAASYLGTHDAAKAVLIAGKVTNSKDLHTAATAKLIQLIGKKELGQGVTMVQIEKFIKENPSVTRSANYLMALR